MIVAGFETSSETTSVALSVNGRVTSRTHSGTRGHVEFCIPALIELLAEAKSSLGNVDRVCVGIGPGLFTGLRVGVQTAKSLAATLDIDLVAVSSLELLGAREGSICACVNAHRGEVFAALFADGVRLTQDAAMSPSSAALMAKEANAVVVGNGPENYADEFDRLDILQEVPSATTLVELASKQVVVSDIAALEPAYLRRSEAEIKWGDKGVRALRPDRIRIKGTGPA